MKKQICERCDLEVTEEDVNSGNALCTGKAVFGYDIVKPSHDVCPESKELENEKV